MESFLFFGKRQLELFGVDIWFFLQIQVNTADASAAVVGRVDGAVAAFQFGQTQQVVDECLEADRVSGYFLQKKCADPLEAKSLPPGSAKPLIMVVGVRVVRFVQILHMTPPFDLRNVAEKQRKTSLSAERMAESIPVVTSKTFEEPLLDTQIPFSPLFSAFNRSRPPTLQTIRRMPRASSHH